MKLRFKLAKPPLNGSLALLKVGSILGSIALGLVLSQAALANERPDDLANEIVLDRDVLSGFLCEPDCGRFFAEGRTQFELEIQQLEERLTDLDNEGEETLLEIDPNVQEPVEQEPVELNQFN